MLQGAVSIEAFKVLLPQCFGDREHRLSLHMTGAHLDQIARCDLFAGTEIYGSGIGASGGRYGESIQTLSERVEMLCSAGVAYWAVSDFYGGPYFQVVGVSLVVSRTTAYLMLPVFSLCILAVCRRTMTFLR